jgi:toxin ParE1/3/4
MKVVWFKRAILDLESARDYINQDNPQAARQVVLRIKEKVISLSEQPGMGRPGRVPNTKELVIDHTSYILQRKEHLQQFPAEIQHLGPQSRFDFMYRNSVIHGGFNELNDIVELGVQ